MPSIGSFHRPMIEALLWKLIFVQLNEIVQMFNYATIKHLLLLCSDIFDDRSPCSFSSRPIHCYSRVSNMNIGTWPIENADLTASHVSCRQISSEENNRLFWTKAFLQTTRYDQSRYRQIASNASERIVRSENNEESKPLIATAPEVHRLSSTIAVSLSETSTRQTNSSKTRSTPQTIALPVPTRKISSHTRFSCYLQSHKNRSKPTKSSIRVPKNNNHFYNSRRFSSSSTKAILKLTKQCREQMCRNCSKLFETGVTKLSSNLFCSSCLRLVRSSNQSISWNKKEETELRHLIELVLEEFQDHFGQALNLSIKQMTQHLLANINLFYQHYQQEFEHLTKKYRLTFLERFLELMNKRQLTQTTSKVKPITRPPNIFSMSSLSGSLLTEKDLSDSMAHLTTPSNSISLSTTSNPSITIDAKKISRSNRKNPSLEKSSSKKTFTLNRIGGAQSQRLPKSHSQSRQATSSSLPLLDAYRFRDTLRVHNAPYTPPRAKLR